MPGGFLITFYHIIFSLKAPESLLDLIHKQKVGLLVFFKSFINDISDQNLCQNVKSSYDKTIANRKRTK
jgi:hypothetical protein